MEKKRKNKQIIMSVLFIGLLIAAWFYPVLGLFIPACMVIGLGFAFFKGRKWCDWYCPRGSYFDEFLSRFSAKKSIPEIFKKYSFRLSMSFILMGMMIFRIVQVWPNFVAVEYIFVILLTVTTIIGTILGIFIHQRIWCYICPIGTFSNLIGGHKHKLFIHSTKCTDCSVCHKVCPMQIKPHEHKDEKVEYVNEKDCLKCDLCVISCPQKALSR